MVSLIDNDRRNAKYDKRFTPPHLRVPQNPPTSKAKSRSTVRDPGPSIEKAWTCSQPNTKSAPSGGEESKIGKFIKQKEPKSVKLVMNQKKRNTQELRATKQTKPTPVAPAAPGK